MKNVYTVTIVAEWLNDKKGGWNVTATLTKPGVEEVCGTGRAVGYSSEAPAIGRAVSAALTSFNKEVRGRKA